MCCPMRGAGVSTVPGVLESLSAELVITTGPVVGVGDFHVHAACFDLRVVDHLGNGVHRRCRHAVGSKQLDGLLPGFVAQPGLDDGVELVGVRHAVHVLGKARVFEQFGLADEVAEALPDGGAHQREGDRAVAGFVLAVAGSQEVAVAHAPHHAAGHGVNLGSAVEGGDQRVEQGNVDVLSLAGQVAVAQGSQNGHRAVQAGKVIGNGVAGLGGLAVGKAGEIHEAAARLRQHVVAAVVGQGTRLAVCRDRGVDDARVDPPHCFVVDTQALDNADAEVFHHHVGVAAQGKKNVPPSRVLEVQGHVLFVAVGVEVPSGHHFSLAVALALRPNLQDELGDFPLFHFDHFGAQVGQQHGAVGQGNDLSHVEDADAFEGLAHGSPLSAGPRRADPPGTGPYTVKP
ncbi:MAG: hypothetical protein KatS3mg131_1503 [Candidatus Tectimicrobiota bacterium]|nr:MAG: hypothetical protein KatS3mg131_1503 [Candidatus Tectomicrobia bacterium]